LPSSRRLTKLIYMTAERRFLIDHLHSGNQPASAPCSRQSCPSAFCLSHTLVASPVIAPGPPGTTWGQFWGLPAPRFWLSAAPPLRILRYFTAVRDSLAPASFTRYFSSSLAHAGFSAGVIPARKPHLAILHNAARHPRSANFKLIHSGSEAHLEPLNCT